MPTRIYRAARRYPTWTIFVLGLLSTCLLIGVLFFAVNRGGRNRAHIDQTCSVLKAYLNRNIVATQLPHSPAHRLLTPKEFRDQLDQLVDLRDKLPC